MFYNMLPMEVEKVGGNSSVPLRSVKPAPSLKGSTFVAFVQSFNEYVKGEDLTEAKKCQLVLRQVKKGNPAIYNEVPNSTRQITNLKELVKSLEQLYNKPKYTDGARRTLELLVQNDLSVYHYYRRIQRAADEGYPADEQLRFEKLLHHFVRGLNAPIRSPVAAAKPRVFIDAYEYAVKAETILLEGRSPTARDLVGEGFTYRDFIFIGVGILVFNIVTALFFGPALMRYFYGAYMAYAGPEGVAMMHSYACLFGGVVGVLLALPSFRFFRSRWARNAFSWIWDKVADFLSKPRETAEDAERKTEMLLVDENDNVVDVDGTKMKELEETRKEEPVDDIEEEQEEPEQNEEWFDAESAHKLWTIPEEMSDESSPTPEKVVSTRNVARKTPPNTSLNRSTTTDKPSKFAVFPTWIPWIPLTLSVLFKGPSLAEDSPALPTKPLDYTEKTVMTLPLYETNSDEEDATVWNTIRTNDVISLPWLICHGPCISMHAGDVRDEEHPGFDYFPRYFDQHTLLY